MQSGLHCTYKTWLLKQHWRKLSNAEVHRARATAVGATDEHGCGVGATLVRRLSLTSAFRPCVLSLEGTIANAADNGAVIECLECFCLVTLSQKHRFTSIAPRLKVIRLAAVLDKADGPAGLDHVATDHRSHSLAVWSTINIEWLVS